MGIQISAEFLTFRTASNDALPNRSRAQSMMALTQISCRVKREKQRERNARHLS